MVGTSSMVVEDGESILDVRQAPFSIPFAGYGGTTGRAITV